MNMAYEPSTKKTCLTICMHAPGYANPPDVDGIVLWSVGLTCSEAATTHWRRCLNPIGAGGAPIVCQRQAQAKRIIYVVNLLKSSADYGQNIRIWISGHVCVCFCAAAHYAMCAATFLVYSYPLADRSAVVTLQFRRVIYDLDVWWRASAGRCRPLAEHEIACNVLDPRVRRKEVCQVCNVQLFSGERRMS